MEKVFKKTGEYDPPKYSNKEIYQKICQNIEKMETFRGYRSLGILIFDEGDGEYSIVIPERIFTVKQVDNVRDVFCRECQNMRVNVEGEIRCKLEKPYCWLDCLDAIEEFREPRDFKPKIMFVRESPENPEGYDELEMSVCNYLKKHGEQTVFELLSVFEYPQGDVEIVLKRLIEKGLVNIVGRDKYKYVGGE